MFNPDRVQSAFETLEFAWSDPSNDRSEVGLLMEQLYDFPDDLREGFIEDVLSSDILEEMEEEDYDELIRRLRVRFPDDRNDDPVQSALTDVATWFDFAGPSLDDLILIHNDEYLDEAVEELENWVSDAVWERLTHANRVEVIRRLREINQMDEEDWREALLRRIEEGLRAGGAEFRAQVEQAIGDAERACPASSSVVAGSSA